MTQQTKSYRFIVARETEKAVMIAGGQWFPKSQLTIERLSEATEGELSGRGQYWARVTMPLWLAERTVMA